jgi:biopolymer transport protein ExbB/TolQ
MCCINHKKILIILLIFLLGINICQAYINDFNKNISNNQKQREISRIIEITYSGLTYIRDEITLNSKEVFSIGFPKEYKGKILAYHILSNFSEIIGIEEKEELFFINIFNNASKGEKIILLTIFDGLVFEMEEKFILKIVKNPIINEEIAHLNLTIKFPSGSNVTIPKEMEALNIEKTILFEKITNIPKLEIREVSIEFKSNKIALYHIENGEIKFIIKDKIIEEKSTIFYNGVKKIDKIYIQIPRNVTIIDVKDEISSLSKTISGNEISIQLRYPLSKGEKTTIIIIYYDISDRIIKKDNEYLICFPSFYNATYIKYSFLIELPSSFNIKEINPKPELFSKELYSSIIKFYRENFIPISFKDKIILDYSETFSLTIFYPYIWLLIIIAIIPTILLREKILYRKEKIVIPLDVKNLLNELIKYYIELNEIREKIISLKIEKISEKELSLIKRKREETIELRKRIEKAYPQISKILKKIDEVNIEANKLLEDLLKLEKEYKLGRIPKKAISTIEKENIKRIKEINLYIEELIEELKGF